MTKILLLRPGALGDIIVTRSAISLLRAKYPSARIILGASSSAGNLLVCKGLADDFFDLSSAAASPLFGNEPEKIAPTLASIINGCDVAFVYMQNDANIARNLSELGCSRVIFHPARPDESGSIHVHDHLRAPVYEFTKHDETCGAGVSSIADIAQSESASLSGIIAKRDDIPRFARETISNGDRIAVIHPGSGSQRKNWPPQNFVELAVRLSENYRIVITSGEADRELGERVSAQIPSATHVFSPNLNELAALLAAADLYVGNDSGVSHLACAVEFESAGFSQNACETALVDNVFTKKRVLIFGPTSPAVWGEPHSTILRPPSEKLDDLSPEAVFLACADK